MARLAGILILLSQFLLVWVAISPNGTTAIWLTFAGTPLVVSGCALGLWTLRRTQRRERREPED